MPEIVFRADSAVTIGIGHIMRCLTLADALRMQGIDSWFICRDLPGERTDLIVQRGYSVKIILPREKLSISSQNAIQQIRESWQDDAQECKYLLVKQPPMAIVVDHYQLDKQWEQQVLQSIPGTPLIVIDDLANREHEACLLLDQTLDRQSDDYKHLVPETCDLLLGHSYTLLRSEFSSKQRINRAIPKGDESWRILVSLGGTDPENLTLSILHSLEKIISKLSNTLEICVIMGKSAPHIKTIENWCTERKQTLIIDCQDMPAQLDWAHLAIGAGGTSAAERCARGLPSLLLVIADNQELVSASLAKHGAAINLGRCNPFPELQLCEQIIQLLSNKSAYEEMATRCYQLFDGKGSERVINQLMLQIESHSVRLSPVGLNDCELLWHWQNEQGMRNYFRNPTVPSWQEHLNWFNNAISNKNVLLFKIEYKNKPAGMLRLDFNLSEERNAEISILISSIQQRKGIAKKALNIIIKNFPDVSLIADIHPDNIASQKAFISSGFTTSNKTHYEYIRFRKE